MPTPAELPLIVQRVLAAQPIVDMHTHLYPPNFGHAGPDGLMLWGLDELVTYHYLVAEVFRAVPATKLPYPQFWAMTKSEQADHIWKHLFVERTPLSEACRGVITTLTKLGLDPGVKSLTSHRQWFREQDPNAEFDGNGGKQRHDDEGDFEEVEEERQREHQQIDGDEEAEHAAG